MTMFQPIAVASDCVMAALRGAHIRLSSSSAFCSTLGCTRDRPDVATNSISAAYSEESA